MALVETVATPDPFRVAAESILFPSHWNCTVPVGKPAPGDLALPGLRLHELKGDRKGTWSVTVSGNWRITFSFEGKDAVDVDYEDYH
jgi:hypothetical protein